jgi:Predicted membrane protein (DUF2207) C-terminal domain/Predicted membrane protein (DUF2207) N-terminal domain
VTIRRRRTLDLALALAFTLVLGLLAVVGVAVGDSERVTRYWTRAQVATDGHAGITESLDYAFGPISVHHGIERWVPGLPPETAVTVDADAPHAVALIPQAEDGREGTTIRVGDPAVTVSGQHRYQLDYRLPGVVRGNTLDWNAIPAESSVPIHEAEVHLLTPYALKDLRCVQGGVGSTTPCQHVEQVVPGHVVATVRDLDAHEGVSIQGQLGSPLSEPVAVPTPPTGAPDSPGTGFLPPAATAVVAGALGAFVAILLVRRAGRERIAAGGEADAAFAAPGDAAGNGPEIRVDAAELSRMATTEFAPPDGVTPAQGGIVLEEKVLPNHKAAWLIQTAIDGATDIADGDRKGRVLLTRTGDGSTDPEVAEVLDTAFDGRDEIMLGSYDNHFATAWSEIGGRLEGWKAGSGLWDRRGDVRQILTRIGGAVLAALAGLGLVGAAAIAGRAGAAALPLVAIAAAVCGGGVAAVLTAWELRVRTAAGSGVWLRVESFRRFLAGSEAFHAEEAAKRGVLREYTAWALAVGEIDRWTRAVQASSLIPADAGLGYVYLAPLLVSSTVHTAVAPSSSSGGGFGGGFGGGGVGGGAGGGSVGSW